MIELTGATMGTGYAVTAVDHSRSVSKDQLQQAVEVSLTLVNRQMSNWDASSEVSRFNAASAGETMQVSAEFGAVLAAAEAVNEASLGRFDIAMGAVIDLWGFGSQGTSMRAPGEGEIAQALACCGHSSALSLSGRALTKHNDAAQIYLSSIGKGFGVDLVARTIEDLGIRDYMIEIGGDLYVAGKNPDGLDWRIGIETPDSYDRGIMQVVGLSGLGMATSGDYRNYFDQDGQRYSHIIDATTGRPVAHDTASVTVLAENAMMADAWATALLVLGRDEGLKIATERDIAALFIDRNASAGDVGYNLFATERFDAIVA